MDTSKVIGLAGRAGGAFVGYRYGPRLGVSPLLGALLGWVVADLVIDRLGV